MLISLSSRVLLNCAPKAFTYYCYTLFHMKVRRSELLELPWV
jgi:hypothetical protein